jgi:hypothetical protein
MKKKKLENVGLPYLKNIYGSQNEQMIFSSIFSSELPFLFDLFFNHFFTYFPLTTINGKYSLFRILIPWLRYILLFPDKRIDNLRLLVNFSFQYSACFIFIFFYIIFKVFPSEISHIWEASIRNEGDMKILLLLLVELNMDFHFLSQGDNTRITRLGNPDYSLTSLISVPDKMLNILLNSWLYGNFTEDAYEKKLSERGLISFSKIFSSYCLLELKKSENIGINESGLLFDFYIMTI